MGRHFFDRRQVLAGLGSSLGLASLPRLTWPWTAPTAMQDIPALAARIRAVPAEDVFDLAGERIAAGATRETVLGATLLAGAMDIRPRPHGILHSVMMVESAFQLADASAASPRQAWHPVFFNLHDFKLSQAADRREGNNYEMMPLPEPAPSSAAAARAEFAAAMDAFDAPRAERAVAALLPHTDCAAFFELFWPFAARCYAYIGHKLIYAAAVQRALQRIGWQHAEPVLRSLVLASLFGSQTDSFAVSREIAPSLPADWQAGKHGPEATAELLRALRGANANEARDAVIASLRAGAATAAIWDAIVLLGSELFQRRPGRRSIDGRGALLPVHALTVPNAFRHAFLATHNDGTRRLLVLQAAAWITALRDDLVQAVGLSMQAPGLEVSRPAERPALGSALESASPVQIGELLLHDPAAAGAVLATLRSSLARRGREHHQHKYAAAMHEEAGRVHGSFRHLVIAPAIDYLAHPADEESEVFARANAALDKAGIDHAAR